jgi:hypothetical protein
LQGDPVAVAARHLVDGLVTGRHQQRAHPQTRHVHVGARGVSGVDGIGYLGQHQRRIVHRLRIGRVGRVELGRHREQSGAQNALQPAAAA